MIGRPPRAARLARVAWNALTVLLTAGLLGIAVYMAEPSPADGPSATPILMTGLLALCLLLLAGVSLVNALRWAAAARPRWLWRIAWPAAVLPGAVALFALLAHAADPNETERSRHLALGGYVLGVLAVYGLNRRADRRASG